MRSLGLALVAVVSLVAASAACKKEKSSPPPSLTGLFPGSEPALFGAAANVKFGITADELATSVPALANEKPIDVPGFPGVTMRAALHYKTRLVQAVVIALPRTYDARSTEPRRAISSAWGESAIVTYEGGYEALWYAPAAHLRAKLWSSDGQWLLVLQPYVPVAELLGHSKEGFAFEKLPLLGAKPAAVKTAYAGAVSDVYTSYFTIDLPPIEYGAFTTLDVEVDGDNVTGFELRGDDQLGLSAKIASILEAKFGEPTRTRGVILTFPRDPPTTFETGREKWAIHVGLPRR